MAKFGVNSCSSLSRDIVMNLADCYRLLGLRTGASYEDIKTSYRRLARQYHPDANPGNPQQAKERFIQLTDAYQRLMSSAPTEEKLEPAKKSSGRSPQVRVQPPTSTSATPNPAPTPPDITKQPSATPPAPPSVSASDSPTQPQQPSEPSEQVPEALPEQLSEIDALLNSLESDRQLKEAAYLQLQALLKAFRFPRAVTLIEGLAQRLPHDIEVRQWQAITYQRFGRHLINLGEPDRAKLYLQKALRTDPRNRALWFEVERDLSRIDRIEEIL